MPKLDCDMSDKNEGTEMKTYRITEGGVYQSRPENLVNNDSTKHYSEQYPVSHLNTKMSQMTVAPQELRCTCTCRKYNEEAEEYDGENLEDEEYYEEYEEEEEDVEGEDVVDSSEEEEAEDEYSEEANEGEEYVDDSLEEEEVKDEDYHEEDKEGEENELSQDEYDDAVDQYGSDSLEGKCEPENSCSGEVEDSYEGNDDNQRKPATQNTKYHEELISTGDDVTQNIDHKSNGVICFVRDAEISPDSVAIDNIGKERKYFRLIHQSLRIHSEFDQYIVLSVIKHIRHEVQSKSKISIGKYLVECTVRKGDLKYDNPPNYGYEGMAGNYLSVCSPRKYDHPQKCGVENNCEPIAIQNEWEKRLNKYLGITFHEINEKHIRIQYGNISYKKYLLLEIPDKIETVTDVGMQVLSESSFADKKKSSAYCELDLSTDMIYLPEITSDAENDQISKCKEEQAVENNRSPNEWESVLCTTSREESKQDKNHFDIFVSERMVKAVDSNITCDNTGVGPRLSPKDDFKQNKNYTIDAENKDDLTSVGEIIPPISSSTNETSNEVPNNECDDVDVEPRVSPNNYLKINENYTINGENTAHVTSVGEIIPSISFSTNETSNGENNEFDNAGVEPRVSPDNNSKDNENYTINCEKTDNLTSEGEIISSSTNETSNKVDNNECDEAGLEHRVSPKDDLKNDTSHTINNENTDNLTSVGEIISSSTNETSNEVGNNECDSSSNMEPVDAEEHSERCCDSTDSDNNSFEIVDNLEVGEVTPEEASPEDATLEETSTEEATKVVGAESSGWGSWFSFF